MWAGHRASRVGDGNERRGVYATRTASPRALSTLDRETLGVAVALLAGLFYLQLMRGSSVLDGTRYFFLDDDMMVSMRYGRNLAEGNGLVWNVGERVEGYTNFLWTVVMAGVHLLPLGDARMAVAMKAISFGLLAGSFYLSLRLLRVFVPDSAVAPVLLLLGLLTCVDVIHWAAWGFETALLGFLMLLFVVCLLEGRHTGVGWTALALIPLVRSDAIHLFAACALLALLLTRSRRRTALLAAAALAPFALHLLFRRAYYGDWLPNTYYLKLYLLDDRYERGLAYVSNFAGQYAVLLVLAAAGAATVLVTDRDRRGLALPVIVGLSVAYVLTTGGDILLNTRFLAHVMPLLFVFAVVAVMRLGSGRLGLAALAVIFVLGVPAIRPIWHLTVPDNNGDPYEQIQAAVLINKNARPDSSVAVIAAGIVPYFTRMRAIDVLGKSDRHVARLRPFPGAMVGHGKLDPAHTLALRPDLVVSYRGLATVRSIEPNSRTAAQVVSFLAAPDFRRRYLPYPIEEEFLLGQTAVFTHPGSSEYARRRWTSVDPEPRAR